MSAVFFDVDTQYDFLLPAGALYVPGAERLLPGLGRLTAHAAAHGIPLISTLDTHCENDPEFARYGFPAHCVAGTLGHSKAAATLGHPGQRFVRKSTFDCFASPELAPVLAEVAGAHFFVYGVVSEICVRCAAMGLLASGARVTLVRDAVARLDEAKERAFLEEFGARGGRLATVDEVCG